MPDAMERIKLEDVDLDEDFFSCSFPLLVNPLTESIRRRGIIRPVRLIFRAGRFVVISGLRRARAARECGHDALDCRILRPPLPTDQELFISNLEDNLSSRPLNLFERARAVRRLTEDLEHLDEQARDEYLSLIGVKGGRDGITKLVAIDGFDERVKQFAFNRNLPYHIVVQWRGLSTNERLGLVELAERVRFTASQLRDVVVFGREIARRDGMEFLEVLGALEMGLDPSEDETSRKRAAFLDLLRKKRLPDYTEARSRIKACLAGINAAAGIQVSFPPTLEGDVLTAGITFRSPDELKTRAQTLLEFASGEKLAEAVALLG